MLTRFALALSIATALLLAACSGSSSTSTIPPVSNPATTQSDVAESCDATPADDYARCFSLVRTDIGGGDPNGYHGLYEGSGQVLPLSVSNPNARPTPTPTPVPGNPPGYGPADLRSAYALTAASTSSGSGQTVAIVDAYDDPTAEHDLGVYRAQYGIPACTTANGCFRKVNETGGTTLPSVNGGWAQEISLDLDMVSAICPNCHILLVEASSASYLDLGKSVNTAASLGGNAISNSYGGGESSSETTTYDAYYNHPGHAITVSSGDSGYGVEYPAASRYVTAVGGTTLSRASTSRGWTETVWSGAGAGCSAYEPQQSWQTALGTSYTSVCSRRIVADVAADANPNTGVAVYDSTSYQGRSGWMVFGGTSVSSPIVASVYALAGNAGSVTYGSYPYTHTASLFDVTSGSDGSCGSTFLCTGKTGYDGPTGNGTPNGTGGF